MGKKLKLYTDGASKGNPGLSGGGYCTYENGIKKIEKACFFGHKTNNQAEYLALIAGLTDLQEERGISLEVYMDSQLIVRQLQGIYRVKDEKMRALFFKVQDLLSVFQEVSFHHVTRDKNKEADRLANEGIERGKDVFFEVK